MITLKRIGYAAAAVSSAGASIYMLSNTLRKRKLDPWWAFDVHGAPPLAIQQQLDGIESDESEDDPPAAKAHGASDAPTQSRDAEQLKARMQCAMKSGDYKRVRELSRLIDELEAHTADSCDGYMGRPQTIEQQPSGVGEIDEQEEKMRIRDRLLAKLQTAALQHNNDRVQKLSQRLEELEHLQTKSSGGGLPPQTKERTVSRNAQGSKKVVPAGEKDGVPATRQSDVDGSHCAPKHRRSSSAKQPQGRREVSRGSHLVDDDSSSDWERESVNNAITSAAAHQGATHNKLLRSQQHRAQQPTAPGTQRTAQPLAQQCKQSRALLTTFNPRPSAVEALSKLQVGDLVKAECPCTGEWVDASVHELHCSSGVLVVRWHNPGVDHRGRPFQPFGEVYADRVRLAFRKSASVSPSPTEGPDHLRIGDACFAVGSCMGERQWFQAKLLSVRERPPELRVEYIATYDGDSSTLRLPAPRKEFLHRSLVRRNSPESAMFIEAAPPTAPSCIVPVNDKTQGGAAADVPGEAATDVPGAPLQAQTDADGDAIDVDLMCSVCSRPDGEALMIICEGCKVGIHTYCLKPPLAEVPDVDAWYCPTCEGSGKLQH